MDDALSQKVTQAFVSMDYGNPVGKTAMDAEGCKAFLPGITEGWETLEKAAEEEALWFCWPSTQPPEHHPGQPARQKGRRVHYVQRDEHHRDASECEYKCFP